MVSFLKDSRVLYIFSNLVVLPAIFIPFIDSISNISFLVAFILLIKTNKFLLFVLCFSIVIKNNSNYRFNLLLKQKGNELSKSDYECVYLYAWCTLLRYFLIGMGTNQIIMYFK